MKNTGGKSLLLLMLIQNIIPNSYLKSEKPLKNIFRGGNPRRTSHCLVEWTLDEGYQYKYMLTGFCARKKQDVEENNGDNNDKLEIDYFNYCYFYNDENKYDIKHLPLSEKENGEKTYMSYDKLRNLIINMRKEELPIKMFDSKKEYMKYISNYGLIPAEWKLISDINVSENYIEKYFKENKTSRKLIENFLIKIIDDVNMQNSGEEEDKNQLANTLIELKDNLIEFRQKSDNKNEFVQVKEMYESLKEKNKVLKDEYLKTDKIDKKAYEAFVFNKENRDKLKSKIENDLKTQEKLKEENIILEKVLDRLEIDKLYCKKDILNKKLDEILVNKNKIEKSYLEEKRKQELAKAQNEFVEYLKNKEEVEKIRLQIETTNLNEDDVKKKYDIYGYNYKIALDKKIKEINDDFKIKENDKKEKEEARKISKKVENEQRDILSKFISKCELLKDEILKNKENIDIITKELTQNGDLNLILDVKESIENEEKNIETLRKQIEEANKEKDKISNLEIENKLEIGKIKGEINLLEERLRNSNEDIEKYEKQKNSLEKLVKTLQVENIEKLKESLNKEIENEEKEKSIEQINKQIKSKKLDLINKYNMIVPNEDIFNLKERLKEKCNYITTGIEELGKKDEKQRKEILDKNPLFVYSIFIDNETFMKLKNKGFEIEQENLVPIVSIDVLRNNKAIFNENVIFPVQKSVYENIGDKVEEYKNLLVKEISILEGRIEKHNEKERSLRKYIDEIDNFNNNYSNEYVKLLFENKDNIENNIRINNEKLKVIHKSIEDGKENVQSIEKTLNRKNSELELSIKKKESLEELKGLQEENEKLEGKEAELEKEIDAQKEIVEEKEEIIVNLDGEIELLKNKIFELGVLKENYEADYKKLPEFDKKELLNEEFETLKNNFEVYDSKMRISNQQLNNMQEMLKVKKELMDKCQNNIKENNCTLEYFLSKKENILKVPDTILNEYRNKILSLKEELENIKSVFETNNSKKQQLEGQINMLIENLLKQKGETYLEENRIKEINLIESKIEENKLKLNLNKKEIKELSLKVGKVNEDVKTLEKECDLLETYIKENEIEEFFVDTSDLLESEILSYKKITTERKNERKIIDKLINEFIQKINFIKDSVDNFFVKQDVLEELQNIIIPSKLADANIVDNGITTIIETLEEKIRHIDEALEILESYQENFITKCFEKAENIVRDLEKLPGLSRIKISGKDTNIIKLDLYEYEKDEKISRMKEYIYGLVKEMEENPDKMTKEHLNESLSSKALVAKIVNMDKASVKLFKIEDIKENSTYKKWEDDLGSDGQVNAIYFMFAVCIISYISMLTRKESSNKSKKVIIADNPFGATSAVFLWDTMFAILKENNVQLIAPGHNINKEIVSKFEVNYVLKHEYFNGNKKSVVVDKELRTEDDIDNMSFDVIEGDQQSMFGI